jgi:hypothetical protein
MANRSKNPLTSSVTALAAVSTSFEADTRQRSVYLDSSATAVNASEKLAQPYSSARAESSDNSVVNERMVTPEFQRVAVTNELQRMSMSNPPPRMSMAKVVELSRR